MNNTLTAKQARFVDEFLIDLNATKAAERAGYSKRSARSQGQKLMRNPAVAAAIDAGKLARSERTQIDADYVLEQYKEVWEAEITDILTNEWKLKPLSEWPPIWRKMTTPNEVKSLMERSKDGGDASWDKIGELVKLNHFPKSEALRRIGEHTFVKAFSEQVEHSGNVVFTWRESEGEEE